MNLSELLAEPVPTGTADRPLDLSLSSPPLPNMIGGIITLIIFGGMGFFLFGWSLGSLPLTLMLSGAMLSIGADLYQLRRLPRHIHVSEEGVTISRLFAGDKVSWWQVEAVDVQPNV